MFIRNTLLSNTNVTQPFYYIIVTCILMGTGLGAASCCTCHCPDCPATPTPAETASTELTLPKQPETRNETSQASQAVSPQSVLPQSESAQIETTQTETNPNETQPILPNEAPSSPPPSLEAFLEKNDLLHASIDRFNEALKPIIGAQVHWPLYSWGGEITTIYGYKTPDGQTQPLNIGRIRFVTATLPDANLADIYHAGQPVVTCLSRFPRHEVPFFVRSDGVKAEAPQADETVIVEGVVWGALKRGAGVTLWLRDCQIVTP